MVIYANEFETKEKEKLTEIRKIESKKSRSRRINKNSQKICCVVSVYADLYTAMFERRKILKDKQAKT